MTIAPEPAPATLSAAARGLGFAGLLPQLAAVVAMLADRGGGYQILGAIAAFAALIYGGVILSFLGGIWWGYAMRRTAGQGMLALVAVIPSLVGAALLGASVSTGPGRALVALGCAILLTLPVDRHLAATGEAPPGWMRLRVPLSLGLGGLTILAGLLAPA